MRFSGIEVGKDSGRSVEQGNRGTHRDLVGGSGGSHILEVKDSSEKSYDVIDLPLRGGIADVERSQSEPFKVFFILRVVGDDEGLGCRYGYVEGLGNFGGDLCRRGEVGSLDVKSQLFADDRIVDQWMDVVGIPELLQQAAAVAFVMEIVLGVTWIELNIIRVSIADFWFRVAGRRGLCQGRTETFLRSRIGCIESQRPAKAVDSLFGMIGRELLIGLGKSFLNVLLPYQLACR